MDDKHPARVFVLVQRVFVLVHGVLGLSPGGVLDISLGGEVRSGPSYPDPV